MQEVKWNGEVLARHITEDDWAVGLSFFSADQEFVQVGTWRYDNGKQLLAHAHNEAPRTVPWTQEVLFIKRGRIEAQIYNPANEQIATLNAGPGDVLILLAGGHGYTILEDDTRVLEIKNGPYLGAEADRRRLGV